LSTTTHYFSRYTPATTTITSLLGLNQSSTQNKHTTPINIITVQLNKLNYTAAKNKLPEATGLGGLSVLGASTDLGDADEIVLRENGVVVGQQRRSLPLRERVRKQRVAAVRASIEAERNGGGAGVVCILYELLEHRGSLRIVEQNLADAAREINRLAEIF